MIRKEKIVRSKNLKVTFTLSKDHPHAPLAVVGDFNSWDASAHPLKRRRDGTHSASVTLKSGQRYEFRYMCERGQWCNDEAADGYTPNAFGSDNCVILT